MRPCGRPWKTRGLPPATSILIAVGDMELFQGDHQSDMWHTDAYGGHLKPGIRMTRAEPPVGCW